MVLTRDPLHVLWAVRAACAQRLDVVDVPSWARAARQASGGAGMRCPEGAHLGAVALDGFGRVRPEGQQGQEQGGYSHLNRTSASGQPPKGLGGRWVMSTRRYRLPALVQNSVASFTASALSC